MQLILYFLLFNFEKFGETVCACILAMCYMLNVYWFNFSFITNVVVIASHISRL